MFRDVFDAIARHLMRSEHARLAERPADPTPFVFDPAEIIAGLPHRPGVYRMLNAAGEVLYVGKALDLSKRVASYFQKQDGRVPAHPGHAGAGRARRDHGHALRRRGAAAREQPHQGAGAALQHPVPRRQDLSVPGRHRPRVSRGWGSTAGRSTTRHRYFGPFPNAGAVRESIQLLQKVFRIRTCEDTVFANRSRPCLLHQIRRCTAPCVGLVSGSGLRGGRAERRAVPVRARRTR